jgi:hypothetical protein
MSRCRHSNIHAALRHIHMQYLLYYYSQGQYASYSRGAHRREPTEAHRREPTVVVLITHEHSSIFFP